MEGFWGGTGWALWCVGAYCECGGPGGRARAPGRGEGGGGRDLSRSEVPQHAAGMHPRLPIIAERAQLGCTERVRADTAVPDGRGVLCVFIHVCGGFSGAVGGGCAAGLRDKEN